jgi:hypothetical protein
MDCGTYAKYRQHHRYGETPDEECIKAARAFWAEQVVGIPDDMLIRVGTDGRRTVRRWPAGRIPVRPPKGLVYAACQESPPEWFYDKKLVAKGLAVCKECPATKACLTLRSELETRKRIAIVGVWGGILWRNRPHGVLRMIRWLNTTRDYTLCDAEFVLKGDSYHCELVDDHDGSHWNGRIEGAWGFD